MKQLLKRVLPIVLAILLLAYALKDVSFSALSTQFQRANYGFIALVGLVTLIGYIIRGKRWQQPLRVLGYQPTTFRATVAIQTGIISSMIVMGSGELTRCATLQQTDGIPLSQGIGSVVAERIVDLLMLLLVIALAMLLEFSRMYSYLNALTLAVPGTYLLISALILILFTGLAIWWALRTESIRQHSFTQKLLALFESFTEGFLAIRQLPNPALFLVLTLINQALYWLSTYLLLLSVNPAPALPPVAALTILAVSSLGGLAVPTQGGIGTYHFLVSRALVLYGYSVTEGALLATFLHAVSFGINLLLSGVSFLILPSLITARSSNRETPDQSHV